MSLYENYHDRTASKSKRYSYMMNNAQLYATGSTSIASGYWKKKANDVTDCYS